MGEYDENNFKEQLRKIAAEGMLAMCPYCGGTGSLEGEDCRTCNGSGRVTVRLSDKLLIELGLVPKDSN